MSSRIIELKDRFILYNPNLEYKIKIKKRNLEIHGT